MAKLRRLPPLSADLLRGLFTYDGSEGVLRWRNNRLGYRGSLRIRAGSEAGWARPDGYRIVRVHGQPYPVASIIFCIMTSKWPDIVDHRDGDPNNNRWGNLREATFARNAQNRPVSPINKCGLKGVGWDKQAGKWRARIKTNGRQIFLGHFATSEAAYAAYEAAAKSQQGDFADAMRSAA